MRRPRLSIGGVMLVVVLLAVDLMVLKTAPDYGAPFDLANVILTGLPLSNALLFGLAILVRARWSRSAVHPFWLGFEAVGWLVLAAEVIPIIFFHERFMPYFFRLIIIPFMIVFYQSLGAAGLATGDLETVPDWVYWLSVLSMMGMLACPQFLLASIGGWLGCHLRRDHRAPRNGPAGDEVSAGSEGS